MEPATAIAFTKTLGKLIGIGYSLWKAGHEHGSDLEKDVAALQKLLEASDLASGILPTAAPPSLQARAVALLTGAFCQTWREHFGPRFSLENKRDLEAHFAACLEWALLEPPENADKAPPVELSALLRDPEKSAYYRLLWKAFTQRSVPSMKGQWSEPLIDAVDAADRRRFERRFFRACAEALATPAGRDLSQALVNLPDERKAWVQYLLVGDMAQLGERHVFGNVRGNTVLPDMPLDGMYVEPMAKKRDTQEQPALIIARLRELLERHRIVVVCADFGHGKSLTARKIALASAEQYLADKGTPGADLELPVFIKCQNALGAGTFDLRRAVQKAQWRELRNLGVNLRDNDDALGPPADAQRTLYLIDGLDEVAFLERGIVELFQHLSGQATDRHHMVVLSRPHILPYQELSRLGIPVLELQPFRTDQVAQWLQHWNHYSGRPPISVQNLQERELLELARTPILLFMIAYIWGDPNWQSAAEVLADPTDAKGNRWALHNLLYEAFFRAIAWGKYQADADQHPHIAQAAGQCRDQLQKLGWLAPNSGGRNQEANQEELVHAMLWLMARVAWESCYLEQAGDSLIQRHVENLLVDELSIRDLNVQHVIRDGLLLAMQADLSASNQRILFGHKSFREFLVAWCWEQHLRALCESSPYDSERRRRLEGVLCRGRILVDEDRSLDFLCARLCRWSLSSRQKLFSWAEATFNDDRIESKGNQPPNLLGDQRYLLRESALTIGSAIASEHGIRAASPFSLRTLVASLWAHDAEAFNFALRAERLESPNASLSRAILFCANLGLAKLSGSDLRGADLRRSDLRGADLSSAHLNSAHLGEADLSGANLRGADMDGADLTDANLTGTDLYDANLSYAILSGADLCGVDLSTAVLSRSFFGGEGPSGVQLSGARLIGANLPKMNLCMANMSDADLSNANLQGANLRGANLNCANLRGADLRGADLRKANLDGANLDGTNLHETLMDRRTIDPDRARELGAIVLDEVESAGP